jgi:hypothetical protein
MFILTLIQYSIPIKLIFPAKITPQHCYLAFIIIISMNIYFSFLYDSMEFELRTLYL